MPKHIHAELMKMYSEDAMETDKPWERWEFFSLADKQWKPFARSPIWSSATQYRRKPKSSRERFEEWWASTGCITGYRVALVAWEEAERQAANTDDKHRKECGEGGSDD